MSENGANGKWKVDLSAWQTIGDKEDWQETCLTGRLSKINALMATVVKDWPHEGDPGDPKSYRKLSDEEWVEAVSKVGEAVGGIFRGTTA